MFDFSILKDIDLISSENWIFFVICLVVSFIFLSVLWVIIKKIVKIIRRTINRIFNIEEAKPKFNKKDSTEWLHQHKNIVIDSPVVNLNNFGKKLSEESGVVTTQGLNPDQIVQQEIKIPVPAHSSSINIGAMNPIATENKIPTQKLEENKEPESVIFGNKSGQTRRTISHNLKIPSAEMLRVEKSLGLNLTREQRSKLVDKYFPKYYGQEITKDEFKKQIQIVSRKPVANPAERKQGIREVELLKKMGGIK